MPEWLETDIMVGLVLSAVVVVLYFVAGGVKRAAIYRIGKNRQLSPARLAFINKFFGLMLTILALCLLCVVWGRELNDLYIFATSFFTLVAIGFFASWSVLSNITCSVLIFFRFPYRIGDRISFLDDRDFVGTISDITMFHILVEDDDGNIVTIPANIAIAKVIIILKNAPTPVAPPTGEGAVADDADRE